MKRSEKLSLAVAAALGMYGMSNTAFGTVSYFDNFDRTGINTGTYTYTTTVTAGDGGADVGATFNGNPSTLNLLTLTNDATATANANGYVYTTTPTSAYTGFNQQLSGNTGNVLTWTLNMQQVRTGPSGFNLGNYGAAVVLGGTNGIFQGAGAGNGYAVIIGNSGTPDPVKLVRYTGGVTNSATSIVAGGSDSSSNYWSVKVTFDPSVGTWNLYTRNDGASAFVDPTTGILTSAGSGVDTTYTSTNLTHSGTLWAYSTGANQPSRFDNFKLDVSVPPPPPITPTNLTWDGNTGAAGPNDVSGTWEAANMWHNGVGNQTWQSLAPDNATFGSGGAGPTTVTIGSAQTAGSLTFNTGSNYTITGAALTVNGSAGVGITANENATINAQVKVGNAQTWSVASGKTLTLGDGVNGGLDLSGGITKNGTGTLLINTPSSAFAGGWTINAGTVKVTSNDANGRTGMGTGAISVGANATLHLDNVNMGENTPINTTVSLLLGDDSTFIGTGTTRFRGATAPKIPNGAGTEVNIKTLNSSDVFTIDSSMRNVTGSLTASSAKIFVSGPGRIKLTSGAVSASPTGDQYSGTWELQGGILQLGPIIAGGFGEPLNALGYQPRDTVGGSGDGPNGPGRPITITGGILAGATNTPNLAATGPIDATTFRSPITLAGGGIASTGGVDATFAGNITVSSNSSVQTTDPVDAVTPRIVVIGTQPVINANSAVVDGNLNWGNATLTVNGGGTLRFERTTGGPQASAVAVTPGATLQINAGATVELDGGQDALSDGVDHVDVVNNSVSTLHVKSGTKNVGAVSGVGNTIVDLGATAIAKHIRQNTLTNNGTTKIREHANPFNNSRVASTSKLTGLVNGGGGLVDLTNTTLVTQDASMVSTPVYDGVNDIYDYDGIHGLVQDGKNPLGGGSWDGASGITTSQSDATTSTLTTLAVGTGAELRFLGPTDTELYAGQTINGNSTIVMYTWGGDANMDGKLDGDDFFRIDSNVVLSETVFGFANGDFNYDGRINGEDYTILGGNITFQQASGLEYYVREPEFADSGLAAVPEPASIGVLGIAAAGLLGRRRRVR